MISGRFAVKMAGLKLFQPKAVHFRAGEDDVIQGQNGQCQFFGFTRMGSSHLICQRRGFSR
jgi:hypothetical protein